MHYPTISALIADRKRSLAKGPVALILVEDAVEVDSTIAHHQKIGFGSLIVFCASDLTLPDGVTRVDHDVSTDDALPTIVNAVIKATPDQWIYWGYNAEYLYYPFCESRSVGEMVAFNMSERRDAVLTYVVDLYASDLHTYPNAVAHDDAQLDKSGYYALARKDEAGEALDRQMDFFGGLRWRFEEHIPYTRRRIDRVALFRAQPGLQMRPNRTFNIAEYNTYACPWHHNMTATVCSFRTAKALRTNPGSRNAIDDFQWHNSVPFKWQSKQLLDLGLMEPGQWF